MHTHEYLVPTRQNLEKRKVLDLKYKEKREDIMNTTTTIFRWSSTHYTYI